MDSPEATLFETAPEAMLFETAPEAMRLVASLEAAGRRTSRELTLGRRRSGQESSRGQSRGWGS